MSEVYAFIGGLVCAAFPLTILYLRAREDRDYFERDRDDRHAALSTLQAVIAKCGPVTSECREKLGQEGGWIKAWMPTARDVMNGHAMLAGRSDLIDLRPPLSSTPKREGGE